MKKVLIFVRNKMAFLGAVILAAMVGGLTTAAVMAAIPDSSGQINACYKDSTQVLRVTDLAGDCVSNETPLSWDQDGMNAYGHILSDGTVDVANSKSLTVGQIDTINAGICLSVSGTPKNVQLTPDSSGGLGYGMFVAIRGVAPDPEPTTGFSFDSSCDPGDNVAVIMGNYPFQTGFFISVSN